MAVTDEEMESEQINVGSRTLYLVSLDPSALRQ